MKKYITTPIYYVNDVPHIGHAYTTIAADVLARFWHEKGEDVFFLTGVDEHGAKIAQAAEKANKSPKVFVDELSLKFQESWKNLNINYSEFFRTTNPKHEALVQELIKQLKDNGYIEKKKYEGLYCVGCERYLAPEDLIDGKCLDHKTEPVKQSEENYFFLLKKVAEEKDLLGLIERDELKIYPKARKNEIIGKIKQGLEDVSISRAAVEWGIKFPDDETQTIYVWVDALLNYYTASKIYEAAPEWPADLHLMAKDILWFHAIIWPAMLLALGLPLPKKVFAHGFFTIDGQKMSKTVGNVLDPNELVKKFGADAVRYALLREFPFGEDGDISEEKIAERYKNDLADGLGNLLQRTLVMINKYNIKVEKKALAGLDVSTELENLNFYKALVDIFGLIEKSNVYIAEKEPWVLAKDGKTDELLSVLQEVYNNLWIISEGLRPFIPETVEKMIHQLGTLKPEPLFPRLDN